MDADELKPSLRRILEDDFRRLASEEHVPKRGERELVFRITEEGLIRWFEGRRVHAPASELEPWREEGA